MKAISCGRYLLLVTGLVLAALGTGWCDGSRLTSGDVIAVTVDEEKDLSKNYQIDKDGAISLPQAGVVKVSGLNTTEAAAEITRALAKLLVSPGVSVAFVERARMQVFVVGQVRKPGLTEIGTGDRVVQALAQAGYDETADLARISIRRGDQTITADLSKYMSGEDLSINVELVSGDTVVVPRLDTVGNVLVLGQVTKTGSVPISRGMTFRELMGLIGGVKVEADTDKITIKRANVAESIPVDYKRALDGDPAADVALQPGDTVYVPEIETAFFTVMGGVNRPGQIPLKGKLTVCEAVGLAGGPMPNVGDLRKVQVARPSDGTKAAETINLDLTKTIAGSATDPTVSRGDVIFVGTHKPKPNLWNVIQTVLPFGWIFR
jgi:polysaccharide export outer membrane protein